MRHMRRALFGVLLTVAGAASAHAEGLYVGGSLGQSFINADWSTVNATVDGSDFAWKLYGGFTLGRFLAVETGYLDLGTPQTSQGSSSASQDLWGWDACGLAKLNLGPMDLYGRYGFVAWRSTLSAAGSNTGVVTIKDDGTSRVIGVGAAIVLPKLTLRAEYEHFTIEEAGTPDLLTVGATISF
jgi:hypothetical protein